MKELGRAALVLLVLGVLTGLVYPFVLTQLAQWWFPRQAEGSLVTVHDKTVGSLLIGQKFYSPRYFHGRPSANDYDAANSGGSNFGPDSVRLLSDVKERVTRLRQENRLRALTAVPADMVLSSGSGLDPHISVEAALLQAPRVARVRGVRENQIGDLIHEMTEGRQLGKEGRINVLAINIALDGLKRASE